MNNKIAAILQIYNEESRLEYTLRSMQYFDEIIIFDKHSTDKSVEIARKYGAIIYEIPLTDCKKEHENIKRMAFEKSSCDWILLLTASDIIHPDLYEKMVEYISHNDVDYVDIPFYRYSMGFISTHSFYKGYDFKDILLKKNIYILHPNIHVMTCVKEGSKKGIMRLDDKKIAVYHLTHENLDIIMERHLRYAKTESEYFSDRESGLKETWKDILRQVYRYFKIGTYKLKEQGKAQLCMLLIYRCAKYLNVYFDDKKEKEIKEFYDEIRSGNFVNAAEEYEVRNGKK